MAIEIGIPEVAWALFVAFLYIIVPAILGGNSTRSEGPEEVDKDGT